MVPKHHIFPLVTIAACVFFTYKVAAAGVPIPGEHFYTTSFAEANNAVLNLGYVLEGVAGYIYPSPNTGLEPLYRLYDGGISRHFYTIAAEESSNLVAGGGWVSEGVTGYVYTSKSSKNTPFYRLFNHKVFDHFYTLSSSEATNAENSLGYTSEGVSGYLPLAAEGGAIPLLRLFRVCMAGQNPSHSCAPTPTSSHPATPPVTPPRTTPGGTSTPSCPAGTQPNGICAVCLPDGYLCCGGAGEVAGLCSKSGCVDGCCCDHSFCEDSEGNDNCPNAESLFTPLSALSILGPSSPTPSANEQHDSGSF